MKQPPHSKFATMLVIGVLLLLSGVMATSAQAEVNLLINPGYEVPFVSHGDSREVAQGWTPWHNSATADMPSWQNAQPRYGPTAPDTTRIRTGGNAQKYYNNTWHAHDAGVYQRVTGIEVGTELRFSVYAYIWSSANEEVDISEEPGDVTFQVGIDPAGGTNPNNSNVVWSIAVSQYDAYRQYSIITTATGDAVTVFTRTRVGFPAQNSFTYLDDAVLAKITVEPVDTDVPIPSDAPESVTPTQEIIPTTQPAPVTEIVPTTQPAPVTEIVPTTQPAPVTEIAPTTQPAPVTEIVPTTQPMPTTVFPSTITHTVRSGETVSKLAVLYGSTVQAIITANNLNENALIYVGQGLTIPVRLPAPATSTPTPQPTPVATATPPQGETTYTVNPGDTLYRIAVRFNTTVAALAQMNGLVNVNLIYVGQILRIPGTGGPVIATPVPTETPGQTEQPRTYLVKPGDNLYRISLRFGVSMLVLSEANGIVNVNRLFAGQVLVIP